MLFVISGIHREFFWPERLPRCLVLGSAALTGKQVECQPSPSAWAAPGGPHCHHLCPAPSFPRAGPRGLFSVEPVGGDETLSKSDRYSLAEGRALIGFWKCRFFFFCTEWAAFLNMLRYWVVRNHLRSRGPFQRVGTCHLLCELSSGAGNLVQRRL